MEQVSQKFEELKKQWAAKKYEQVGKLLEDLKMDLTAVSFLPTSGSGSLDERALFVAREVMEIGAEHSVAVRDVQAFKRYMAILKTYYMDYAGTSLPESVKKYELLGLNLICLLSQNRTAEFHTELELLPAQVIQNNTYITYPVRLEQFIMEGSYNKVIDTKGNVPAASYSYFIEILLDTIRDEIASCMEKSYEKISASECLKMLSVDKAGLSKLVEERGWLQDKSGKVISFTSEEEKKQSQLMELPAKELAEMAISYAKEMEQIV